MKLPAPQTTYLDDTAMEEFILGCPLMEQIMAEVVQIAPFDVSVMITGESGTGKELLARIIHLQSKRAEHPFVPINCGVLSGNIFEDRLFGHEKGAFTGAESQKIGCFEMAHQGTLFLDEISELPLENQVDFLRVLEDFRFMRIGGNRFIQVDVRLIAATNKDLKKLIAEKKFRQDLYYRLQVVPIHLPPLRQRREAIGPLVDHFLTMLAARHKKNKPALAPQVLEMFQAYPWPGNIRELKNVLERIFVVNKKKEITPQDLPLEIKTGAVAPQKASTLRQVRIQAESKAIARALARTGGDREAAARLLAISPRTLRHKIRAYGLKV